MPSILKIFFIVILLSLFSSNGFCASVFVDENGRLGIGTTTPGAKLSFNNLHQGNDAADGITWYNPAPLAYGIYRSSGRWAAPDYTQLTLKWGTGIVIDGGYKYGKSGTILQPGAGNVGIGTTTPAYKLDVNGTIRGNNVSASDVRWKTNINTIKNSLEKISKLRGVTYEWSDLSKGTGDQIGVIAQEVEDIFPEAVSTDKEGYKSVAYSKLAAPLIEAVKELKNENEVLKKELMALKQAVSELSKSK